MKSLNINIIRLDGGTQQRVEINDDVIEDYAHAILEGAEFPLPVVFHDGSDYWLGDGFQRVHAYRKAGKASIKVDVREGTQRDAVLFSVGANGTHGLRRTHDDKRKAVRTLLNDAEWSKWSDREIARQCGVTHPFVANLRPSKVVTVTTPKSPKGGNDYQQENQKPTRGVVTVTTPAVAKAPVSAPTQAAANEPADDGMESETEMLAGMESDIRNLNAQVEALSAGDQGAELRKQITIRQGVESRLAQEMEKTGSLDRQLRADGKKWAELRKLTSAESNAQVVSIVRDLTKKAA